MTGNAFFTNLQTSVQALATAAAAYKDLAEAATGQDEQSVIKRNAARENIIQQLHAMGMYITAIANNNEAILASSGFSYTQDRKSAPI